MLATLKEALTVLGIGFGVVFVGLICLIGIINLMSFIVRLVRGEYTPAKRRRSRSYKDFDADSVLEPAFRPEIGGGALSGEKRRETVAAVSAAIAEYLGEDVSRIRISSIKRIGGGSMDPAARREIVAVISAAIAEEMGSDVTGIRIVSIRKAV